MSRVAIQEADFDPTAEIEALTAGKADVGAVASFVGVVRGGEIRAMTLEYYPGMTEKAIDAILAEAQERWHLLGLRVIHRVGRLLAGERIVLVVAAAGHRGEAFAACEFVMDYLKTRAPFWKREETAAGARWVDAREADDSAAKRWG
ncbi:MAG TPA: molybdenum cofactor biosynthesis protein MoaE [Rhodocyclaceae bacterium]|nr:molybdenum cofactor biosynthesis protein MoaE [Rhodocyclaceae bacterium]